MNEQQRAVVQQALEALERMERYGDTFLCRSHEQKPYDQVCEAIDALNQLLEQPVQEPVACANGCSKFFRYTTPPAQPAVPEGWKLVPVEPTERMVEAGLKAFEKRATSPTRVAWKAMLAAAPEKGGAA